MPKFHSNVMGNVMARVEMLIPLCVTQATVLGIQHGKALLLHCSEGILVLGLLEDRLLDQPVQLEWVV